jgi:hypothetical protein
MSTDIGGPADAPPTAPHRPGRGLGARLILGVVGGFLAGVVFIAINSWFVSTMGKPAPGPFMTIASLAQGPAAAMTHTATIWYGEAIHSVLSALFGVIYVLVTHPVRSNNALLALAGLVYGGIVYAIDFQVFARFVPQFKALTKPNQPLELAVHLAFGAILALFLFTYRGPRRTRSRPR